MGGLDVDFSRKGTFILKFHELSVLLAENNISEIDKIVIYWH